MRPFPTILTTVVEERGGYLIQGLQDVFPDPKPINRTFINTREDSRVVDAVRASGRKKGAVQGELQRDWAREATIPALVDVNAQHGGGGGVAYAWETQLLNTPVPGA